MSILSLFQWLQSLDLMTFVRESGLTYPVIMSTHLTCIAVFGGMIVMTDLRMLGVALQNRPIADVVNGLRWWKRLGFVIMVTMGLSAWDRRRPTTIRIRIFGPRCRSWC